VGVYIPMTIEIQRSAGVLAWSAGRCTRLVYSCSNVPETDGDRKTSRE